MSAEILCCKRYTGYSAGLRTPCLSIILHDGKVFARRISGLREIRAILLRCLQEETVQQRRFAAAADARKRLAKCAIAQEPADDS